MKTALFLYIGIVFFFFVTNFFLVSVLTSRGLPFF